VVLVLAARMKTCQIRDASGRNSDGARDDRVRGQPGRKRRENRR
jgi:hypothetical protein